MDSEAAYATWAPERSPWSPWVKPILFASVPSWDDPGGPELDGLLEPPWLAGADRSAAFVVDLPGAECVRFGVALARRGWRPVPLFNALPGPPGATMPGEAALVDVASIVRALRRATSVVGGLALAADAPPAFLLDADRRHGAHAPALPGRFDNRSISLPTDFPSGVFLRAQGIRSVVLVQPDGRAPQTDLAHTLVAWQAADLPILAAAAGAAERPGPIRVAPPSNARVLWYRLLATLGLRKNPLGGFGGTIPVPSAG
jgi:hypothetical protein